MAAAETITIALSPEPTGAIRDAVASGEYASANDVVREALSAWTMARTPHDDDIRRLWDEGLASGSGRFADLDALMREARRRFFEGVASER